MYNLKLQKKIQKKIKLKFKSYSKTLQIISKTNCKHYKIRFNNKLMKCKIYNRKIMISINN